MQEYIISINSVLAEEYTTSSNFKYNLTFPIDNVKWIQLISGHIPATTETMLYYDIGESNNKRIHSKLSKYDGVLRYNLDDYGPNSTRYLLTTLHEKTSFSKVNIKRLSSMSLKLFKYDDELVSFTNPGVLNITSIVSVGNNARIETSVNHGLNINDTIWIRGVDNMSTNQMSKAINTRWIVINVPAANRIDIALDVSGELANQTITGYGTLYPFGYNAIVKNSTGGELMVTGITANVGGSVLQLAQPHGLAIGSEIRISGMETGVTQSDNNLINGQHTITGVPTNSSILIPSILSAYPVIPVLKTNSPIPFILGSHGKVYPEKNQCSFEFLILSDGKIKELSDKLSSPHAPSIWETKAYKNKFLENSKYIPQ